MLSAVVVVVWFRLRNEWRSAALIFPHLRAPTMLPKYRVGILAFCVSKPVSFHKYITFSGQFPIDCGFVSTFIDKLLNKLHTHSLSVHNLMIMLMICYSMNEGREGEFW